MSRTPLRPRGRLRGLYLIPITLVMAGLILCGFIGLDYARQTVWINQQSLPIYNAGNIHDASSNRGMPREKMWLPKPKPGEKIAQLSIPRVGLSVPVVEGTDDNDLKRGAGHYIGSALPGQGSNVFIAGHRDTVFTRLKDLKVGDRIVLATPYGDFTYTVQSYQVVSRFDVQELSPTASETLTLSTCYPFGYIGLAPKRFIVHTRLLSVPPELGKPGNQ